MNGPVEGMRQADPSHPISTKLQKWATFSVLLGLFGLGADVLAVLLTDQHLSYENIFGKGELYIVSVGMLASAAGELLYDRTRLGPSAAWQVTLSMVAIIVSFFFGIAYGFVKSGKAVADSTASYSLIALAVAFGFGVVLVVLAGLEERADG